MYMVISMLSLAPRCALRGLCRCLFSESSADNLTVQQGACRIQTCRQPFGPDDSATRSEEGTCFNRVFLRFVIPLMPSI